MSRLPFALLLALAGACSDAGSSATDATDPAAICATCTSDQICVQIMHSNGQDTCQSLSVACQPRAAECSGTACTPACGQFQCNRGFAFDAGMYSCQGPVTSCPNFIAGALQCWGP